jgi:hypothetical protein
MSCERGGLIPDLVFLIVIGCRWLSIAASGQ